MNSSAEAAEAAELLGTSCDSSVFIHFKTGMLHDMLHTGCKVDPYAMSALDF